LHFVVSREDHASNVKIVLFIFTFNAERIGLIFANGINAYVTFRISVNILARVYKCFCKEVTPNVIAPGDINPGYRLAVIALSFYRTLNKYRLFQC